MKYNYCEAENHYIYIYMYVNVCIYIYLKQEIIVDILHIYVASVLHLYTVWSHEKWTYQLIQHFDNICIVGFDVLFNRLFQGYTDTCV